MFLSIRFKGDLVACITDKLLQVLIKSLSYGKLHIYFDI